MATFPAAPGKDRLETDVPAVSALLHQDSAVPDHLRSLHHETGGHRAGFQRPRETLITITRVITAIIGGLARLILPGKQNIPIWLTIVVGIAAAVSRTFITRAVGSPPSPAASTGSNYSSSSSWPSSASPWSYLRPSQCQHQGARR